MVQVSLKKIISKKEVVAVIRDILKTTNAAISIQDASGRILLHELSETSTVKYPVKLADEVIGWVVGKGEIMGVATLLSYLAQQELEKKALAAELLDKYRETTLLYDISEKMTATLDLKEVASLLIDQVKRLSKANSGSVMLVNEATGQLQIISDFGKGCLKKATLNRGEGIVGFVVSTGRGEIVNDVLSDARFIERQSPIGSLICVPLKAKDKIIGAIEIRSETLVNYTAEDLKLLTTIASQAASAIEIALLHSHQLQESRREGLLLRIANQIHHSLNLDTILSTAVGELRSLLQIDRCMFIWYRPSIFCITTACPTDMVFGENQPAWEVVNEAKKPDLPSTIGYYSATEMGEFTIKLLNKEIVQADLVETIADPTMRQFFASQGFTSLMALPIQTRAGKVGVVVCGQCKNVRCWSEYEMQVLQAVAEQLAIALNQAELYEESSTATFVAKEQTQQLQQALQELQQTQAHLIQNEKMSSLGQLVAGVAHEINNPISFIGGNIFHVHQYVKDLLHLLELYTKHYPLPVSEIEEHIEDIDLEFLLEDLPKLLSSMKVGVDRIRQIVLSLRNFSRLDEAEFKPVNIHEGIDGTLMILEHRLKVTGGTQGIQVIKEYGDLPLVECYAGQLNQVFMNILSNAIDVLDMGNFPAGEDSYKLPTIQISTFVVDNNSVAIRILDNGAGMSEQVRAKVFDPFFTTKPVGKGTGLGLSISYKTVVEKHGGVLKCFSAPGKGTEFWIQIPIAPQSAQPMRQNFSQPLSVREQVKSANPKNPVV